MNVLRKITRPHDPFFIVNDLVHNLLQENSKGKFFSPFIEIKETANFYYLMAEMPGLNKEDVEIQFDNNSLYLKGEKKIDKDLANDEKIHYSERIYGQFARTIPFSDDIDAQKISASFDKGILKVNLPKIPADKTFPTKINIQ